VLKNTIFFIDFYSEKNAGIAKSENPYKSRPKNFSAGCDILPKTHKLGRMMKWPKYIRTQRQLQVLKQRLKVPGPVALFERTADKSLATQAFDLFEKYKPFSKVEKKQRMKAIAAAKAEGKQANLEYREQVKFGLNHVTNLVQSGKAQLVLIAHDVEPLELVIWLPTLCHKMNVPFGIVKGKSALGRLVNMKTATCVCLTKVRAQDGNTLETLKQSFSGSFNEKFKELRKKGPAVGGTKTQHRLDVQAKMIIE